MWCSKQNTVAHLKYKYLAPHKILGWLCYRIKPQIYTIHFQQLKITNVFFMLPEGINHTLNYLLAFVNNFYVYKVSVRPCRRKVNAVNT